ncbi:BQ2448_2491 [Microbotryum intermedium]|uniref:BQ2448_2491 protein n=1 Tax=Microbotryum intermedium TaxID=269621 RepID=A0A238FBK0_9BASI|nr:BQ2448_2491 [Microbotryum intermedium]
MSGRRHATLLVQSRVRSHPCRPQLTSVSLLEARGHRARSLATSSNPVPSTSTSATSSTSSTSSPPRRPGSSRTFLTLATGLVLGSALALTLPRPRLLSLIFPSPTPLPHAADSEQGRLETQRIEEELQALAIVQQLRQAQVVSAEGYTNPIIAQDVSPTHVETSLTGVAERTSPRDPSLAPKYRESRPYAAVNAGPHSLSGYTLRGPSKFAIPPLAFTTKDNKEAVFVMHLGRGLCGHEGVVHGGLLATVLDESLAWTALQSLPSNIGVTATLSLSYKKPTFADQFVVVRTEWVRQEGRKVWVQGQIEDLDGQVLVQADALFVEPKMAKFLSSSSVREHLK